MADVIWRNAALEDLDAIIAYIAPHDHAAAARIAAKLLACGDSLTHFPHRGRPAADGRREMTTVPPYVLRYEVDGDRVHILSIRHGARRPD